MGDICGDNRFEIISKANDDILKSTNISSSEDEMKALDNFLFRCWQMGWLDRYNEEKKQSMIKSIINAMLTAGLSQDKWTKCPVFRCVMNTGWVAGEDRYKCRIGKDCNSCGAINRTKKPIIVKL